MPEAGLRERKKARTRRVIADAAARLFAERGYEQVAVSDVAREAEVSEQTVYNYFQTKEQLVTDLDRDFQEELDRLIRTRAPGTTPAAAIRELVLDAVEGIRRVPPAQWRGELGYLAAISPTVHRLALEMSDRQAQAIAAVLTETSAVTPALGRLQGIALAGVFQIITEAGRRNLRRAKPRPDRRRAAPGHRRSPTRPRPLAGARRQLTRPGSMLSGHGKVDNRGCARHCRPVTLLDGSKAQRDVTSPVVRAHDTDAPFFVRRPARRVRRQRCAGWCLSVSAPRGGRGRAVRPTPLRRRRWHNAWLSRSARHPPRGCPAPTSRGVSRRWPRSRSG